MDYKKEIIEATFKKRPNRFNAIVNLDGEDIIVHVPNTGRNKEILVEGCRVFLRKEDNPTRKTQYDLIQAYKGNLLINIDSQIPNKIVEEALKNQRIEGLKVYNTILREKTYGKSRFDFKLSNEDGKEYFLEVKGVTLESEGNTMFPDAPTERGTKHILELIEAKKEGYGAGIIFVIQIEKMKTFTPHKERDQKFAEALLLAKKEGVEIYAYDCIVRRDGIELDKEVKILL